jgi:hypothetical protein
MSTLPHLHVLRVLAIDALLVLGLAALGSGFGAAQVSETEVASDSEIELLEQAESGTYQHYSIKISTHEGQSILATNKDGVKAQFKVSSKESLALWRSVLKNGLETMADTSPETASPDESQFTVKYRVGQTVGEFSAVGVDTHSDGRYRNIVRAILALGDKYSKPRGQ